ncbi:hypothetical protein J6590_026486 [Homalodisca vitripennis]|nr:hypothetical protein J6590_026486 [Homalodisca vitripennis]
MLVDMDDEHVTGTGRELTLVTSPQSDTRATVPFSLRYSRYQPAAAKPSNPSADVRSG